MFNFIHKSKKNLDSYDNFRDKLIYGVEFFYQSNTTLFHLITITFTLGIGFYLHYYHESISFFMVVSISLLVEIFFLAGSLVLDNRIFEDDLKKIKNKIDDLNKVAPIINSLISTDYDNDFLKEQKKVYLHRIDQISKGSFSVTNHSWDFHNKFLSSLKKNDFFYATCILPVENDGLFRLIKNEEYRRYCLNSYNLIKKNVKFKKIFFIEEKQFSNPLIIEIFSELENFKKETCKDSKSLKNFKINYILINDKVRQNNYFINNLYVDYEIWENRIVSVSNKHMDSKEKVNYFDSNSIFKYKKLFEDTFNHSYAKIYI